MAQSLILTLNAGSSTIKFAVFALADAEAPARLTGRIEDFGPFASLTVQAAGSENRNRPVAAADHGEGLRCVIGVIEERFPGAKVAAVGHRIVHGGKDFAAPMRLDAATISALEALIPLAPLHQPHNLAGVRAAIAAFPDAAQIACFDTAFHRSHPLVADTYGLPMHFHAEGIRRYGFHGLSYDYLTRRLRDVAPALADGRIVFAHLGNGASLCATRQGRSIASTMGFTALDGLPMGTRCGQIDPGVLLYLMSAKDFDAAALTDLLYRRSGLKGMSGLSNDMRELSASGRPEAALAIDYFVHHIRRGIAALAADLGGLDGIVFSGGIGENADGIRAQVLEGLGFLGVALDQAANRAGGMRISTAASTVAAFVIPTDEEWMIATHARTVLG